MKVLKDAVGILERTSHYLRARTILDKPAWYDAVAATPPHLDLTKKPHSLKRADPATKLAGFGGSAKTRVLQKDRANRNHEINRVPKLRFVEDQLRDVFYHQHPWELARPKVIVETDGDDNSRCDWLRLVQLHRPLDGESVVQRTLWLLKQPAKPSLFDAYDQARFEFYQLRMREEVGAAVAREEAEMSGAHFNSTHIQWGLKQEQIAIDRWVKIADQRTRVLQASRNKNADTAGREPAQAKESVWDLDAALGDLL